MVLPTIAPEAMLLPLAGGSYFVLAIYGWGLLQHTATGSLKYPTLKNISTAINRLSLEVSAAVAVVLVLLGLLAVKSIAGAIAVSTLLIALAPVMLMAVVIDKSISSLFQHHAWRHIWWRCSLPMCR